MKISYGFCDRIEGGTLFRDYFEIFSFDKSSMLKIPVLIHRHRLMSHSSALETDWSGSDFVSVGDQTDAAGDHSRATLVKFTFYRNWVLHHHKT